MKSKLSVDCSRIGHHILTSIHIQSVVAFLPFFIFFIKLSILNEVLNPINVHNFVSYFDLSLLMYRTMLTGLNGTVPSIHYLMHLSQKEGLFLQNGKLKR